MAAPARPAAGQARKHQTVPRRGGLDKNASVLRNPFSLSNRT